MAGARPSPDAGPMAPRDSGHEAYRVVILSSLRPRTVTRLAARLARDVPDARVVGVLYEPPSVQPLPARVTSFLANLRRPEFWPYMAERLRDAGTATLVQWGHGLLRLAHAGITHPNGWVDESPAGMSRAIERVGGQVLVTRDVHSTEALEFVRGLAPHLGLVYGTRILKPALFEIPRDGSINVHKRQVPEYRGGGPIGLWELLDGRTEIGVTVHRVSARLDAGHVIRTSAIPIEPFDTLGSLELKANVVGDDLLVASTRDFASGTVSDAPQEPGGRLYRTPTPEQMRRHRRTLAAKRPGFQPRRTRPLWKLLARVLAFGPRAIVRNWSHRRHGSFPIIVLYHHVVTDRPHRLGIPTGQFLRHVEYLARHYRILSLPDAVAQLRSGRVDCPSVVLTFDDGYADNVLNVRAVADAVPFSATFFLCSDVVSSGRPFHHDQNTGDAGFAPMTWTQARDLRREGFDIGSHTRTHFDCGSVDLERLSREIVESRREIEMHLGESIASFSFPWGRAANMSEPAVQLARDHYDIFLSACNGTNTPHQGDLPLHVRRCVHPETLFELELTLQSLLEIEPESARLSF